MSRAHVPVGLTEPEDPAFVQSNGKIGVRLFSSAILFLFMAFVFAFFYLRALNSNNLFHPPGVNPPQGYGVAILVCVLACTLVMDRARRALAAGAESNWRTLSLIALILGVAVFVLQIVEYIVLPFTTSSGGFASVFWGWSALWLLIWLGAIYWMETLVAQTHRSGIDSGAPGGLVASADGCAFFLATLAGVEVVAYICLYLIK